ncbi:MAG: CHAP domain-containing protein [Clostridiales bacterium]|nr:CHAP domain-containing protein [Clostridiales bacterium]
MTRRILVLLLCFSALLFCAAAQEQVLTPIPPTQEIPPHVQAVLDTALAELGYAEQRDGTTKYGEWYGDPKAEWCAEFLCWSVHQAEKQLSEKLLNVKFPLYGATNIGRDWFLKQGRYIARTGFIAGWGSQWYKGEGSQMEKNSYIPQPGDWVFFSYTPSGDTTHVALVEQSLQDEAGNTYIHVIEGNNPDRVQRAQYKLDDWRIQGYGTVRDLADIVLRGGIESEKVKALQEKLVIIGLLSAQDVHGRYNNATQEAVRTFQSLGQLTQTGIANQQTQLALAEYAADYMMNHTEFWTVDGTF